MQKNYRRLLFDFDNTLVDDDENRRYTIKKILIERKENVNDEKIENFINLDNQFWKDRAAEKAGHMKPHNEFFEKFFRKIGTYEKDDMIIIGDELEKDILGGIKNSIDSCWVNIKKLENNTTLRPNYEINDLIELKNIL